MPERVGVTYVVAAPERVPDDPVNEVIGRLKKLPFPRGCGPFGLTVTKITSADPILARALEMLCCPDCSLGSERLLGTLMGQTQTHLAVTCTATPGWPPLHLWTAAVAVDALANLTGGVRLDAQASRLLPSPWRPARAAAPMSFAVGAWIWIGSAPAPGGHVLFTTGMNRLGLPELAIEGLVSEDIHEWGHLFNGVAQVLTRRLFAALAASPERGTLPVPAKLRVTEADVAMAEGRPLPESPRAITVGLHYDRPPAGRPHRLTVIPLSENASETTACEEPPLAS